MNDANKNFILKQEQLMRDNLPHLYGHKLYQWQHDFIESQNRICLLTAANQVGKSTSLQKKLVKWATSPELWPVLWPSNPSPRVFWYLYPSQDVANLEFEKKWVLDVLPRGHMKEDPIFGWKEERDSRGGRPIKAIHFKTGVSVYFKFYSQNVMNLQAATVHAVFADEEVPENYYGELKMRLNAVGGHFNLGFTATRGQELWFRAMERIGKPDEAFRSAWKRSISLFDCRKFMDGSDSHWSEEKIQETIDGCGSDREVQKRVHGRFVRDDVSLKYHALNDGNLVESWKFDPSWMIYSAVDPGNGGKDNHPAAFSFVSVNSDYSEGYVFLGWRGDGIQTTSGDVLEMYRQVRGELKVGNQFYDYQAKDFYIIADRDGEPFLKADKKHDVGEEIMNTILGLQMLKIVCGPVYGLDKYTQFSDPEQMEKLVSELRTIDKNVDKRFCKDDLADSVRYAVTSIPWDFEKGRENLRRRKRDAVQNILKPVEVDPRAEEIKKRRDFVFGKDLKEQEEYEQEIEYWNELYGN